MGPSLRVIRRHPERAVPRQIARILEAGLVAHVAYARLGVPTIIPLAYFYDPCEEDLIYLHGAPASDVLQSVGKGVEVCVAVTHLDALVYSKSAKSHSMNYRSVVCFGVAHTLTDTVTKDRVLARMIERYFPDRVAGVDYAPAEPGHVRGTAVVAVRITSWSAKARTGGPGGPNDADPDVAGSAGVREPAPPASREGRDPSASGSTHSDVA